MREPVAGAKSVLRPATGIPRGQVEEGVPRGALAEILPVFLDGSAPWWLRPRGRGSWAVGWSPSTHPRQLVIDSLAAVGFRASLVHSTSWRHFEGCLVLTHLAVLSGTPSDSAEFDVVPVRRRVLARGGATRPPTVIHVEQVIEHALRHLAWLARDDALVGRCLGERWPRVLDGYAMEPFRVMECEAPLTDIGSPLVVDSTGSTSVGRRSG
jgi:hypothetical protein